MVPIKKNVGKVADEAAKNAANFRFRNLNGAILMSRFKRERLAARYGLTTRGLNFLTSVAEFTRSWSVVGSGADARVVSNVVYPGQAALAAVMNVRSKKTVDAGAKECEAAGLVTVTRDRRPRRDLVTGQTACASNRYQVTLLAAEVCADAAAAVAAVAGDNALALVRETGEKVPAEVSAATAVAAPAEREDSAVQGRGMRLGRAADAMECSNTSKGSSSSSRGGAAEEEEVRLCLSDGRTVTGANRGKNGNIGGFLSDGHRFGCDEATMAALRAGAAVEARRQQGGYLWLVVAAQGRSRDAEGLRELRTSDCRTRLLLCPDECHVEYDEAQGCWIFYFNGTETAVGFTDEEAMARQFSGGTALVADSHKGELNGAWCAWRNASNRDASGEVALGKPKPKSDAVRSRSWAS